MVDLQLGLCAVLRGPTHIVEHSEGVSGLVERVLDVTPCSSIMPYYAALHLFVGLLRSLELV